MTNPSPQTPGLGALDEAMDSVLVLDRALVITYANKRAAEIIGRPVEALLGRPWEEVAPPNGPGHWRSQVAQLFAQGAPLRGEGAYDGPEGPRWYEYTISPQWGPGGSITHLVVVGRDFTERRIAQHHAQQLQLLAQRLSGSLSQREVGDLVIGQLHDYLGANASLAFFNSAYDPRLRLVASRNVLPEALERMRELDLAAQVPPALAARLGKVLCYASPAELERDFPGLLDSPAQVPVMATCAVPLAFEGEILGALALSFPSPRKFPEETVRFLETLSVECAQALVRARLLERERRARAQATFLAEATTVMASSLDVEEVLGQLANLAVPRLADWCAINLPEGDGYRTAAVAHADDSKVELLRRFHEEFPSRPGRPGAAEVLVSGEPLFIPRITREVLAASARSPRHLQMLLELGMTAAALLPLKRKGKILGVLSLIWTQPGAGYDDADVAFLTDLAGRAALALENAELYREASAAVRLRDDFLAMAGHELRTPLAALLLQLSALERQARGKEGLASLAGKTSRAINSGLRLDRLVGQLLDVSRITAGRLVVNREPMSLTEVAHDVVERLRDSAELAGSTLVLEPGGDVRGEWDRLRVEQVVTNLVSNAVKYGARKPVTLRVEADGGAATLTVRDQGIGIDPAERGRLFQRFERAVSTRDYGGLGLGLWISRQIVEALGGQIQVQSETGQGSTFTVKLPLEAP